MNCPSAGLDPGLAAAIKMHVLAYSKTCSPSTGVPVTGTLHTKRSMQLFLALLHHVLHRSCHHTQSHPSAPLFPNWFLRQTPTELKA